VGERRIGKSSLLNYLCHPKIRMKYLQRPNDYRFVFIDFQEKRGIGIPTFFQSIYAFLLDESRGGLALDVQPDYEGFKKVVTAYDEHGLNIIMLFDEFESITQNQKFDTEFYSFLRSIANNYNIGYVLSSGRNLQTLCHSRAISDSPFFNIFSNTTLSHFSQQEALELITGPSQELGYSLEYYAPFVFDIAGYYPFFIQMACAVLFEYVRSNESITDATFERVKEEFLDEARVHFQQIWDTCDDDQRDVLLCLCQREKVPNPQKYVLTNLIKGGYAKVNKKQSLVFSSLFEEFILERYSAKMARKKKKFLFWNL
jgi:serine/threonine-protein kinase